MMYQNRFVVAIKHNGKILREYGDIVKLPFGSEFTVLVKNLHSRRAKFSLHIDGVDALETQIIVNANSEVELKRFIRNGNMEKGNAFKFIERTESIDNGPRGIRADDGLVRVEYWFEKEYIDLSTIRTPYYESHPWYGPRYGSTSNDVYCSKVSGSTWAAPSVSYSATNQIRALSATASNVSLDSAEKEPTLAGITVPGSQVDQKFTTVYGFNSELNSGVIVLRLVGKTESDKPLTEAVTVQKKQKCVTCGKVNKATAKFCSDCGTALELL